MQSLIHAIDTLLRPWPLQLVINLSDSFSCHIIIYIPSQFMNSIGLLTLLCWISSAVLSRMQSEQGDASENCIVAATLILSGPSWLFSLLQVDVFWCIHKTQCLNMHVPCFKSELLSCLFIWYWSWSIFLTRSCNLFWKNCGNQKDFHKVQWWFKLHFSSTKCCILPFMISNWKSVFYCRVIPYHFWWSLLFH